MTLRARLVPMLLPGFLLLLPAFSAAQATGSAITGVVRDTTEAVLPGTTVEASSPALIEGTRTVVADAQGVYRIIDLRPGTYKVTFTLQGFRPYVRDGIVLTSAFTATVNGALEVGELQEALTVTGEAPIVDVQNTAARSVFTRDTVDALPIARTSGSWAEVIPAMRLPASSDSGATGGLDVGSTQSERSQAQITVHGGTTDIRVVRDGMEAMSGVYSQNRMDTQETTVQMGGNPAEAETGGVRINIIPREGANRLFGAFELDGTGGALQGNNIDDALQKRGLVGTPSVKQAYNAGGSVGGPIAKDKLWFFGTYRKWGSELWLPGKFYNKTQGSPVYTPDSSRQASTSDYYGSFTSRVTWSATQKQKFNFTYETANNCNCVIRLIALNRAPEATADHVYNQKVPQATWQYVKTNRLLFDGGFSWYYGQGDNQPVAGVGPNDIAIKELTTGFFWNARADGANGTGGYGHRTMQNNVTERFNVSYVTGSHNLKSGMWVQQWPNHDNYYVNGGMLENFQNGVPSSVTLYASPQAHSTMAVNLGLYAQDQWVVKKRLTLDLGLRYDAYRGHANAVDIPSGPWVPARHFDATGDLTNLKDLNPRLGVSYDLFGNGRTAVKGFLGRFIVGSSGGVTGQPSDAVVTSATRTWADNGDFIVQSNELGPLSNSKFGSPQPSALTVDPSVGFGWGNRAFTWQGILSVDHEIRRGLAIQLAYYRTTWGNQNYTYNTLVTSADYDTYCITAPTDAGLPNSGQQVCGLADVKPAKFGQINSYQTLAGDKMQHIFNGIDLNTSGRFPNGATIGGGIAFGDTVIDNCGTAINPQDLRFCRTEFSWSEDVQFKINGTYPLPWGMRTSYIFQSVSGFPITADYSVTNAAALPSLNRNFSAGAKATSTVALVEPYTMFEKRSNVLDLRFSKRIKLRRGNITANADVSNALNANTPQYLNTTYGPDWLKVTNALSARVVRLGVQMEF